jgi:PAS domain S-box-containing protein
VLIVEDDPGVARLQQRRLERAGYTVVSVGTAEEGMLKLAQGGVELVLLDYRLPGGRTGLDVYAAMQAAGHDLPVIIVTGFSEEATVIKALRAGVRDFVTKSLEYLDYLPEAVSRALKQVRLEQQLAQSQARLAGIIGSARDAILTVDGDGRITQFNAAAEQVFRCTAADAVGLPVQVFIPPSPELPTDLFGPLADKAHLCATWFEQHGVRTDGKTFPLEASISSADVAGRQFRIVIVRDVTERKLAEDRVREQAALIDRATDAILVCDPEDRIRSWNQGAERLYGWTVTESVGKKADQLLFGRQASPLDQARAELIAKGQWSGELRQVTKNGKEVVVDSHWTLVRADDGRPRSTLVINTDVTEKKKLEAQFLRVQRMESIGTLAGGIAHDLNNVLVPILLGSQLLQTPMAEVQRNELLETIRASAERGADLVKQVLLFARGVEGQRVPVEPSCLVKDLVKLLRSTLPKTIAVQTSFAPENWTIKGDATQLTQVLMNLCVNARDAMPRGGRLSITVANAFLDARFPSLHGEIQPGPHLLFQVADTGTGMPPEVMDKIFEPFFTTKEIGKGTGLGLSTVLGIVRSHGGAIDVASTPGKGSLFSVYLPAIPNETTAPAAALPPDLTGGRGEWTARLP